MAELLIVVAIISVLVAISIPIFTSKLESSRETVDLTNMRNAYGVAKIAYMTSETLNYSYNIGEGNFVGSQTFGLEDVLCVYDAASGRLVSGYEYSDVKGYGKGTSKKGGCETSTFCYDDNFDYYNESSDVEGQLIAMIVQTDGTIYPMYWTDPLTTP